MLGLSLGLETGEFVCLFMCTYMYVCVQHTIYVCMYRLVDVVKVLLQCVGIEPWTGDS